MDAWLVAFIACQLAFFAFLLWLAVSHYQKNLQRRSDERLRIVERFSSAQELSDFLDSQSGGRFFKLFGVKARNPAGMLIGGLVLGILLLFVGGAFLLLVRLEDDEFLVPAVLILSSGLGSLVATGISYRLAHKFQLLSSPRDDADED